MSRIGLRLKRLARHFREGTIGSRIAFEGRKRRLALAHLAREWRKRGRRWKWRLVTARSGYADIVVEGGGVLRLHADSRLSELIYVDGYELNERHLLARYLRAGDLFVDVGANLGLYTTIAAARVGAAGKVLAFEPAVAARLRLEENIQLNGLQNVEVLSCALSDRQERRELAVPTDGHDAWSSLGAPIEGGRIASTPTVVTTWDAIAAERGLPAPTMMKLDVEGWESRVLAGASATLHRADAPLLQVEFTDSAAQNAGSSCRDLYAALTGYGYTVCRYDRIAGCLVPDKLRPSYPYVNLYATKRLAEDNRRLGA